MSKDRSNFNSMARFYVTGFMMGSADVVPGVSGGTIAFIMGIYRKLVDSIKTVSGKTLKLALKGEISQAFKSVPWTFILPLLLGIFTAIISLAHALSNLLESQPISIWSFFFGLVLASIFLVGRRVKAWTAQIVVAMVLATGMAYYLVGLVPVETPATLLAFFLSGAIAICAMILPGVSGSFLLVIMGKYAQVLNAVTEREFLIIGVFMLGAVFGLAMFSRLLSWLFQHYHDLVVASLIGLMIGSLRRIWPYKETVSWMTDRHGVEVPMQQINVLPGMVDQQVIIALVLCLLGAVLVWGLGRLGDQDDEAFG